MNKTLNINLAGYSFIIDDHAYIKLNDYLKALRKSLDTDEADEVMHDIETRIVEIFKNSMGKREVVNDSDVEKVISQIGAPEIIEEQEEVYLSDKESSHHKHHHHHAPKKQLFRDPENAILGGVCSGLAYYFGIHIKTMRAIWLIIAILGIFSAHISTMLLIFIYIILWIVIPQAQTASDFLKMKGKPVNFDNLKKESNKIVQFTNEAGEKVGQFYNESKPYINKASSSFLKIFRILIGVFIGFLALVFLVSSFAIFSASLDNSLIDLPGNLQFFLQDDGLKFLGLTFAFLTLFIPAVIFTYLTIKLFSPETKLNYTGYVFAALIISWLIILALLGIKAFSYKAKYKGYNEETEKISINSKSDSLFVDLKKVAIPSNFTSYGEDIYSDKKSVFEEDYPVLNVIKKEGQFQPYVVVKKEARGYNKPLNMQVPIEIKDNKILLPNYINYTYNDRMRQYNVSYELVVPKNKTILALNNENGFNINDENYDNDEDNNDENDNSNTNNLIKVDSTVIVYNSKDKEHVLINGKKVPITEANKILKKDISEINNLEDAKDIKDINISINNGEKEIIIKTK